MVQLCPVGSRRRRQGVAAIERARLQRELDITPTQVRIILSTGPRQRAGEASAGYEGYVQGGRCESPTGDVHVELKNRDDDEHDVTPFQAISAETANPSPAYYGSAGAPGFGLAAAYTDQDARSSRTPSRASRPRAETSSSGRGRVRGGRTGARADPADR